MKTLVILNIYRDATSSQITAVSVGFFDEQGKKQMEITYPAYLFPSDIKRGQQIFFSTLSPIS